MEKKKRIIDLYYLEHKAQKEIANIIGTTSQYISKIVKEDNRYKEEKQFRKDQNAQKQKIKRAEYQRQHRKNKDDDIEYQVMLLKQRQHAIDISGKTKFFNSNVVKTTYSYTSR